MIRLLKRNDKGITLIELLIVFALIGILLTTTFSFFMFGNKTFSMGTSQNSTQSDLRITNDYIVKAIRYATDFELGSAPSSIDQTDKYDYIYLNGTSLIHSAYNSGNARIVRTLGNGLQSTTSFWTDQKLNSQMVGINIFGQENNQEFDLQSNIELPNIALKKNYFPDTTDAKSIKFIVDLTISTPVTPPDEDEEEDPSEQTFVTAIVKVLSSKDNRIYRITLNSIPIFTTESESPYSASFTVLSNSSYSLKVEQKLNATNYKLVGDFTFDVNGTNVTKEISD